MGKRPKATSADARVWREKAIAAMSERDDLLDAIGADRALLRDVIVGYARVYKAAHPLTSSGVSESKPATLETPLPGDSSRRERAKLRRVQRRLRDLAREMGDDSETVRVDRPWCSGCRRRASVGARFCQRCGTGLDSRQARSHTQPEED